MMLRDRMVYAGIRTSKRFARLTWFERDMFMGLLLVADDYGRFEADADTLRTVLFGPLLSKVSARDVQRSLMRFAAPEIGLVKLYTVKDRGYGKVINFRQTLTRRRALYPDEEDGPPREPELFQPSPPLPPLAAPVKEGKKEVCGARFARRTHDTRRVEECLNELASRWSGYDIAACLRRAAAYVRKERGADAVVTVEFFEKHWMPGESKSDERERATIDEPDGWAEWHRERYGKVPSKTWAQLDDEARRYYVKLMAEARPVAAAS
jgi:hypothetical protein